MGFILLLIAIVAVIVLFKKSEDKVGVHIPQIYDCSSIKDVVMSINHGRVYPFFTRMNLERVKNIVKKKGINVTDFENNLHLQELMGRVRGVHVPLPNNVLVKDMYLNLNKKQIVSSITINISSLDFVELVEQMLLKFGEPISVNRQLMVWQDTYMTISLDSINKYITVMDERLPS